MARQFFEQGIPQKEIAGVLAVSEATIHDWCEDLIKDAKEEEERKIIDLYLKCLTSEEIANVVGLSDGRIQQIQPRASQIISELRNLKTLIKSDFYGKHLLLSA